MIGTLVYQLTRNLSIDEIKKAGFDAYFVDHTTGVYHSSAAGVPFTAAYLQSKGDVITDLHENMAAEQKARTTYDNILRLMDDPDVCDVISSSLLRNRINLNKNQAQKRLLLCFLFIMTSPVRH